MTQVQKKAPVIYVVDDDESVLTSLKRLLNASGYQCSCFLSAEDFLEANDPSVPGCAVFDLNLPGLSGFELQKRLASEVPKRFIVFLTGEGDVPGAVQAMQQGAVHFLTKPVEPDTFLSAIAAAVDQDAREREGWASKTKAMERLNLLTPREREVLDLVVQGLLNKQIAARLGVAEKTVKVHRGRMMKKITAGSVPELVRLVQLADELDDKPTL